MSNSLHPEVIHNNLDYERTPLRWTPRAKFLGKVGLVAAGLTLTIFGGAKAIDYATAPDDQIVYSSDEITEVAQDESDTIWKYANTIEGVGTVVTTQEAVEYLVQTNPGLKDGLSQGEAVNIPKSVEVVEPVDSKE